MWICWLTDVNLADFCRPLNASYSEFRCDEGSEEEEKRKEEREREVEVLQEFAERGRRVCA
jgi:hypothetical protein